MASAQVLARRVALAACRTHPDPSGYGLAIHVPAAARCVRVQPGDGLTHLTQVRDLGQNRFELAVDDDGTRFLTVETLKMGDCLPGEQVYARIGVDAGGPPHWMRWELVGA